MKCPGRPEEDVRSLVVHSHVCVRATLGARSSGREMFHSAKGLASTRSHTPGTSGPRVEATPFPGPLGGQQRFGKYVLTSLAKSRLC